MTYRTDDDGAANLEDAIALMRRENVSSERVIALARILAELDYWRRLALKLGGRLDHLINIIEDTHAALERAGPPTQPFVLSGSFACPICGLSTPHGHEQNKIDSLNGDRRRNDGWTSIKTGFPAAPGNYLAFGHRVVGDRNEIRRIRDERNETGPRVEVLGYDLAGGFHLLVSPWVGSAGSAPRRMTIYVQPEFWRLCPNQPTLEPPRAKQEPAGGGR